MSRWRDLRRWRYYNKTWINFSIQSNGKSESNLIYNLLEWTRLSFNVLFHFTTFEICERKRSERLNVQLYVHFIYDFRSIRVGGDLSHTCNITFHRMWILCCHFSYQLSACNWRIPRILLTHAAQQRSWWGDEKCNIMTSKIVISTHKGIFFSLSKQKLISCKFSSTMRFSNKRKKNTTDDGRRRRWEEGIMAFGKNVSAHTKIAYACRALDFISLKSFIWKSLILWFLLLLQLLATYADSNQIISLEQLKILMTLKIS